MQPTSLVLLYISRFLGGLGFGSVISALPHYAGEVSTDEIRGAASAMITVMYKLGILYAYVVGPYVSLVSLSWAGLIPPIVFICIYLWLPETPYYLLVNNKREAARNSLIKLRGHCEIDEELQRMELNIHNTTDINLGFFKELLTKRNRMSLCILLTTSGMIQLSGGFAILSYAQTIFDAVHSTVRGSDASILLASVQLLFAICSSFLIDRLGRRPLLLMSTFGTGFCCALIGIYFSLVRYEMDTSTIGWIPLGAMFIFIACFNLGITTVPFAMLGEMFPPKMKAIATILVTMSTASIGAIVLKLYQIVTDNVGIDVSFWLFSVLSFLYVPFVWFIVPETKGKPFDVIFNELNVRFGGNK